MNQHRSGKLGHADFSNSPHKNRPFWKTLLVFKTGYFFQFALQPSPSDLPWTMASAFSVVSFSDVVIRVLAGRPLQRAIVGVGHPVRSADRKKDVRTELRTFWQTKWTSGVTKNKFSYRRYHKMKTAYNLNHCSDLWSCTNKAKTKSRLFWLKLTFGITKNVMIKNMLIPRVIGSIKYANTESVNIEAHVY